MSVKRTHMGQRGGAAKAVLAVAVFLGLSGCAAPVVGALTIGEILTIAGISSSIMTGRDLGEHVVSALTGKDCRFLESLLRNGRAFCEEPGSDATQDDFGGVIALLEGEDGRTQETLVAASALDPHVLGFVPVDRRAAHEFSLEIAREAARGKPRESVSFGMMSATFGQSFDYRVDMEPQGSFPAQVAESPAPADTSLDLRPSFSASQKL
ncbi:MAG: hypothetical protein WD034_01815 [Parvibaculum sp.]|uniref:hypothetical protein n=1 Tax=Parvibaculum sp. TaxID=2024848 RepID=UPI0034A070A9